MSKRDPCDIGTNPSWTGLYLGDCSQHLKTGECPIISGFVPTFGGAAYISKPVAIISGRTGGTYASGFYGYGHLDRNGYVDSLEIVSSGWHFTQSPVILMSGVYKSGVGGSYQNYNCSGQPWDDPKCLCSGSGLILGHKIYENVTRVPPQCSMAYLDVEWPIKLARGDWPECTPEELQYAVTDNYGRCLMPIGNYSGLCMTTFASGWTSDCSDGEWRKTNNYCKEKGGYAPRARCVGDWYFGNPHRTCGPEIRQEWRETDNYLDFGVCKKRGYKNVVAMKSWHGEPPFTSEAGCWPQESGDYSNTVKYLYAVGTANYNMMWNNLGCVWCGGKGVDGHANSYLTLHSAVDRNSSKNNLSQTFHYDSCNAGGFWDNAYDFNVLSEPWTNGVLGLKRCQHTGADGRWVQSFRGFWQGLEVNNDVPSDVKYWNTGFYSVDDYGYQASAWEVRTSLSVLATSYAFVHEISAFSWIKHCHAPEIPPENVDKPATEDFVCEGAYYWDLQHNYHYYSREVITMNISNPYNYNDLNADVDTLLNEWNLLDDLEYPWKTSEPTFLMPKVTRCEGGPTSPLTAMYPNIGADCDNNQPACRHTFSAHGASITWDDCQRRPDFPQAPANWEGCENSRACMDCNKSFSDVCVQNCYSNGRIVGGPAEVGHFGSIDFMQDNREDLCCNCDCETFNNDLTYSWGDGGSLHHLTQWPNSREQRLMYFGAFGAINDSSDASYTCTSFQSPIVPLIGRDILVKGKYAEIIQMDKPSRNFRMPCGIGSSGDWTLLNNHDTYKMNNTSAEYSGNCANQCGCGTINVDTPEQCYACTGQGEIEPERWPGFGSPTSGCEAIIGLVSGVCSTTGVDLELSGIFTGQIGDYVNGFFTLGNLISLSIGTYRVQEILGDYRVTLSGSFSEANNYVSGWIDVAQNNDWFDNRPKGEFVVRSWSYPSFADAGYQGRVNVDPWLADQTVSDFCLPYQGCDPSIVIIAPNNSIEYRRADSFGRHVKIIDMPNLTPQTYGARFHIVPQQWMIDPIWVPPSQPCCIINSLSPDRSECQTKDEDDIFEATNIQHTWEEDNGSCSLERDEYFYSWAGGITIRRHHYYPMRPFVEARVAGLSPYTLPMNLCAYPHASIPTMTGACWSIAQLEGLTNAQYSYLGGLYGFYLCPTCSPPNAGDDYWGSFAPWLAAANQESCIREAWPQTDVNPIKGFEKEKP